MHKKMIFAFAFVIFSFIILSNAKALTEISSCQELNQTGETYILTQDIIDSEETICINIVADNVVLDCQGHTIDGLDIPNTYGIYIVRDSVTISGITIKNCNVNDWNYGFFIILSYSNTFINNTANSNGNGFLIEDSSGDTFINNTANSNSGNGFLLYARVEDTNSNTFINNTANSNSGNGFLLYSELDTTNSNTFINNTANSNSHCGFYLYSWDSGSVNSNTFINNTANSNSYCGFYLYSMTGESVDGNIFTSNIVSSNYYGFYLYNVHYNLIKDSIIAENYVGIFFDLYVIDNYFYNNLLNNTNNVYFSGGAVYFPNYFNTTKQLGKRIYGIGDYIGGNYWTNPSGNGYSDTCEDANKDGFCNEPYVLNENNIDYLPLSSPPPLGFVSVALISPSNETYYGDISFEFFAISNYETFILKAYLNDEMIYENNSYQNNTLVEFSRLLLPGVYNFTVYVEKEGVSNSSQVFFTSLGYCGDNVCIPEYENSLNCFKDCGGTGEKSMISMVVIGLGISAFVLGIGVIDIRRLGLEKLDPEAMAKISIGILIFLAIMFYIITNYLR
ncbi:MAG: NosD domain-containing protein [Candidatus Aenigmatarchaeota archaeon]